MFGTPNHPLEEDLIFGIARFAQEAVSPHAAPAQRTKGGGLVLGETGTMVTHSADPQEARVILQPRPKDAYYSHYATEDGDSQWDTLPRYTTAVFRGETQFDGVVFDGFAERGIVARPIAVRRWRHISFAANNAVPPAQLFQTLTGKPFPGDLRFD